MTLGEMALGEMTISRLYSHIDKRGRTGAKT